MAISDDILMLLRQQIMKKNYEGVATNFLLLDSYLTSEEGVPPRAWVENKAAKGLQTMGAIGIPLSVLMQIVEDLITREEEDPSPLEEDEMREVSESETMSDIHNT